MSYDPTRVTINYRPNAFQVYGKLFSYPAHGHADHFRLRDEALRNAKQFGIEQLAIMQRQKGAALSKREEMTGHFDPLPDARPMAQRVREDSKIIEQPAHDPDRNPWTSRLEELQREVVHTPWEKGQRARRLQQAQDLSERWERNRAVQREKEQREADPQRKNMREHAAHAYNYARRDPSATAEEIHERKRLLDLANSDTCEPTDYWPESNNADQVWFRRLDSIAADKEAAVDEARTEHTDARMSAKNAREVDRAVDSPLSIADVSSTN